MFYKNGMAGFKDKSCNIIVEAIYGNANEFYNGVGRVRIDVKDGYIWRYVDINGNLLDYDEVDGFFFGVSKVKKDGKFGFINTAGELIVPLIYDGLFCSYTENGRITYALKDGKYVSLNLKDGYEEVFEKYDEGRKQGYKQIIDISNHNILVYNGMLIADGESDPNGARFPIYVLQAQNFDLYTQEKKLGTYKAELQDGVYEGDFCIFFPEYIKAGTPEEIYYAVLKGSGGISKSASVKNTDKYDAAAKQFLIDNNIDNTPFAVGKFMKVSL